MSLSMERIVRNYYTFPLSTMELKAQEARTNLFGDKATLVRAKTVPKADKNNKKIGQGSYGEVFQHGDNSVIKKMDTFVAPSAFEFTSICELAILAKNRWVPHLPTLEDVSISEDGSKYLVQMKNGGITLLQYSKLLTYHERVEILPWIGYQLVKTALALRNNGIIHTDIKCANVLVDDDLNLRIIDFGICSFETLGPVDSKQLCDKGTSMCHDWGTYCICPPETYLQGIWIPDKFMTWSIGITLCDFLFSTHSFIHDHVMSHTDKQYYKKFYKNDDVIQQVFSTFFKSKQLRFEQYLTSFQNFNNVPMKMIDLLQKMLTINHNNRWKLDDLIMHSVFKKFYCKENITSITEVVPEFLVNSVDAPLLVEGTNIDKFKYFRGVIVQWMYDFYDSYKKLQLFVHAVILFDRFLAVQQVPLKDYVKLGATCIYLTQYIHKRSMFSSSAVITSSVKIVKTLLHNNNIDEPQVHWNDIVHTAYCIMFAFDYDLYRCTFDVLLLKQGIVVDMNVVVNVLINNVGPYDNEVLLKKYMSMKY